MGQISSKLRRVAGGRLAYYCQGCDEIHMVKVEGSPAWGFNGNPDMPTFTPSVLVTGSESPTEEEYARIHAGERVETRPTVCHTFITDGRVQFLGDCSHVLAGQTLNLPDLPERFSDANYSWGDPGA